MLLINAQCAKNGILYNYLAGAAEQGGGGGGGGGGDKGVNRPPNVRIGGRPCPSKDDRWYIPNRKLIKYLAYNSERPLKPYTHTAN